MICSYPKGGDELKAKKNSVKRYKIYGSTVSKTCNKLVHALLLERTPRRYPNGKKR
jgi:hypothetical protein